MKIIYFKYLDIKKKTAYANGFVNYAENICTLV